MKIIHTLKICYLSNFSRGFTLYSARSRYVMLLEGGRYSMGSAQAIIIVIILYYYYKGGFRLYLHAGVVLFYTVIVRFPLLPPPAIRSFRLPTVVVHARGGTHGGNWSGKPAVFPRRRVTVFTPPHLPSLYGFPLDRAHSHNRVFIPLSTMECTPAGFVACYSMKGASQQ